MIVTRCDFCQGQAGDEDADTPAMILYGASSSVRVRKIPRLGRPRRYRRERARYDLCPACMRLALKALRSAVQGRKL